MAPSTREGRVQEVVLANLSEAGRALGGRIFDLLDATASGLGFDYTRALAEAQRSGEASDSVAALVPDAGALVSRARELAAREDNLRTPANLAEARERFAADRLEAINPVIVEGFLRQLARTEGWAVRPGPAVGILLLASERPLPAALGAGRQKLVSADGEAVRNAWSAGVNTGGVSVLGPTEETFAELVAHALRHEGELLRGSVVADPVSLSDYHLFVWGAEIESHDGVRTERQTYPFLLRYSGGEAFPVAWESVMKLQSLPGPAQPAEPAAAAVSRKAAHSAVAAERDRLAGERQAWIAKIRLDLDDIEARYQRQITTYPDDVRQQLRSEFRRHKAERLAQLELFAAVNASSPRPLGWLQVRGTGTRDEPGLDPDSEKVAVRSVVAELEAQGFQVDDRQTAGLGYDIFARHRRTGAQRLIEVKGIAGSLRPITLEQHEWAQAQQRRSDYWLYVIVECATAPRAFLRLQDPATALAEGPRLIERVQIPISKLRQVAEGR